MTTDKRSNDDNDEEKKQGEQGHGGTKAIYTRYRNRMQATTEQELRRLLEESTEIPSTMEESLRQKQSSN